MSKPSWGVLVHHVKTHLVLVVCALVACGGDDDGPPPDGGGTPSLRVPQISELRPAEAPLFGEAFALEVHGADFDGDAVVILDGQPLVTRVVSPTELSADVPAAALAAPGVRVVAAAHAGPDGGTSGDLGLRIVDGIAAPLVDALVPDRAFAGAPGFGVSVHGWNFYPTSVVHWAGSPRTTTYVSASELRITVDAADVTAVGAVAVTVLTEGVPVSAGLAFTVEAAPAVVVARVNLTSAGAESGAAAFDPSVSADGRFVAFVSQADDLVAGDTGRQDVFWRDTCRGAAAGCTPVTRRISERMGGGDANNNSQDPVISANGRFVAFASGASDLVAGDTNGIADVFVHDTCAGASGCTPTTVKAETPTGFTINFAIFPSLSGDGRFVAYTIDSSSVWLADTCLGATGCTPSVVRLDALNDGTPGNRGAETTSISATGRYVAFTSRATNLGGPTTVFTHAYLVDTCLGASGCTRSITRLDEGAGGAEANGNVPNRSVFVSADGRYATFSTFATNLLAAPISTFRFQVYLRDTCNGVAAGCTPSTTMISQTSAGMPGDGNSMSSSLTPDGRFVAFQSKAPDLVAGDTNGRRDVFVRDTCIGASGCTPATRFVSLGHDGMPANDESSFSEEYAPRISDDGRAIVWASGASNLVPNDTNTNVDVFISIGAP